MENGYPTDEEIDLRMRRAVAARVARHAGFPAHAREIENGFWDDGVAMTRLAPFFKDVILIGPASRDQELAQ